MTGSRPLRGALAMLVAAIGWPLIEAVGAVLMPEHPAPQVVALRYTAHLLLLAPLALLRWGPDVVRTRRLGLQLLRGVSMFLMPVFFVAGARLDGSAWEWSVFWTMVPLVLGGAVLLGDRPSRTAWAVAFVGLVGAWFARESPTGGLMSAVLGVASALCFGSYIVLSRVLRHEHLATSLFYTAVGALLPTLGMAAVVWVPLEAADIAPTLGLGVLSVLILGAIDVSLESDRLSRVVPWLTLVPALEVAVAVGLGDGMPGRRSLFGTALIATAAGVWGLWTLRHTRARLPERTRWGTMPITAQSALGDEK